MTWLDSVELRLEWATPLRLGSFFDGKHSDNANDMRGIVYRLIACGDDQNAPIGINRVVGTDSTGTLYIGQSHSLFGRIGPLKKSAMGDAFSHPGGVRYFQRTRLKEAYSLKNLWVTWAQVSDPKETEHELFIAYINEFGEEAPFNCQGASE